MEFGLFEARAQAHQLDHTRATLDVGCQQLTYSPDGNPFPLCPGPYPGGGNCVWWAWEQWHLLGYNLPLNWGNAADWIVDAERFGLPIGTTPRLGSIAVFPVADGVWAFGTAGHVAFVTWVSPDASTFNVTYQNYGDPTPMYSGRGYNVGYINQPRFQDGAMRFIYFPGPLDASRFARLPGVDGNGIAEVSAANAQAQQGQVTQGVQGTTTLSVTSPVSRVSPGLSPGAYDQQFDADFTGNGNTDLLLYQRRQGILEVMTFADRTLAVLPHWSRPFGQFSLAYLTEQPQQVSLGDSLTPAGGWGSSLDIRLGDFSGDGHTDILLYDRVTGRIQILSLSPQLTVQRHMLLPGWGPGWELYVGRFDGQRSGLLLYKRDALAIALSQVATPDPTTTSPPSTPNPTSTAATSPTIPPSPHNSPTPSPSPSPTATPTLSPTATLSPSPSPSPGTTPTPSPSSTPTPTPTLSPSPSPAPSPTPGVSPTPDPTPTLVPSPTPGLTPSPIGTAAALGIGARDIPTQSSAAVLSTPTPGEDLSGEGAPDLQGLTLPPNVLLVNFTQNLHIEEQQSYTLLRDTWEIYTGRFVSAHQDGLVLYDRLSGQMRIMDFTATLRVRHFQALVEPGETGRCIAAISTARDAPNCCSTTRAQARCASWFSPPISP